MSGLLFKTAKPVASTPSQVNGLQIQKTGYGNCIPLVYGTGQVSGNLMYYNDWTAIAHSSSQSVGKGGGTSVSNTTYTYTATVGFLLAEGPINGISKIWRNNQKLTSPSQFGLTIFPGTYPQSPWGYLSANHPDEAIGYQGVAYAAAAGYDLGSGSLGNHLFEVQGILWNASNPDCNPKDVIVDFLTNENYGAGFPAANLGDYTDLGSYCDGNSTYISPSMQSQSPAHERLTEWATVGNAGIVWSEKKLKIIPFDKTQTVVYNLTDDDFQADSGEDPIKVTRKRQADAYNCVKVEFLNRDNDYTQEVAEAKDMASIEQFGLREMPTVSLHSICLPDVARFVAQGILQRQLYIRNTYEFKLSWKYCLLEPMDLVTITDAALGLNQAPVRITEIDESEDGLLSITAEEYNAAYSNPAAYLQPPSSGYNPDWSVIPTAYSSPTIFLAPSAATTSGFEIWMAVANLDANYGGSQVWMSYDDSTYFQIGKISGNSRVGVTSADLVAGSDPDTVHSLAVDLSSSKSTLESVNQTEVDTLGTLCLVGGEFLAFRDATLTGASAYDLNYLRRGVYGSAQGSSAGARFVKCDDSIFKYAYNPALTGKTVYFKFPAYNKFGSGLQDLSTVPAFTFAISGQLSLPAQPSGFSVSQSEATTQFSWLASTTAGVTYEIRFVPLGAEANWRDGIVLASSVAYTSFNTTGMVPGDWTFMLSARDSGGNYSNPVIANFTVADTLAVQQSRAQAPEWQGTLTNLVKHWTGKVLVKSQNLASADDFDTFDVMVPNPYATAEFEGQEFDLGSSQAVRAWAAMAGTLPDSGVGAVSPQFWISTSDDGLTYSPFTQWGNGMLTARFIKPKLILASTAGTPAISKFTPTIDQ
ncbi:phage tail protein [Limnobacter litoralis]|uniref:Tip attachment protein J domain-containing protein n=1 Tax=Limnobacter litoralis TaxID=481366 RepID=A0ABQ5YUD7_9BURK|nr:phage tail protein [Limnobacter litoralis]GLR26503.1 hypothetical protein GCM10007875_15930 [Limnobacter litoralis]